MMIYKEITNKVKERTYFHDLPTSEKIENDVKTVGKVTKKREVAILYGDLMEKEELDFYQKIHTALLYGTKRIKFSHREEAYIVAKTLVDIELSAIIKHLKGFEVENSNEVINNWIENISKKVEEQGKINDIRGMAVIVLDDGINDIQCIVDESKVEEGKIYEVQITKNEYQKDRYLVIGENMKE